MSAIDKSLSFNGSDTTLEAVSQDFNKNITNECGGESDLQISRSEDIVYSPNESLISCNAGTGEFPHQQVRVEEKNDKADFN
jgi:hypothetical protein